MEKNQGRRPSLRIPKPFPSFLLHLNRKQRLRMKFKFPKFREGGFICCACHSKLYRDIRKWKLIGVDSSITCSLCCNEIQDCEKMIIPPCNDFRHSLHYDCCESSLNGCPLCRKGLKIYLTDTLRNTRSIRYLPKNFKILELNLSAHGFLQILPNRFLYYSLFSSLTMVSFGLIAREALARAVRRIGTN